MKDTIRKIDEFVYGISRELFNDDKITLEDVLVAMSKKRTYVSGHVKDIITIYGNEFTIDWQLTKTLTQQSEETQNAIKQIFNT